MNEKTLLPCPFCGADGAGAYYVDANWPHGYWAVVCSYNAKDNYPPCCNQKWGRFKTKEEAITAWNTRTTLPAESKHCDIAKYADNCNSCGFCDNQPLTLGELREMEGEPVWIDYATAFGSRYEKWAVQAKYEGREDVISFTDGTALISSKYGCKWFAYRQKPTEG